MKGIVLAEESKVVVQGLDGYIVAEKNGQLLVCSLKEEQRIKKMESNICQIKHQTIINE